MSKVFTIDVSKCNGCYNCQLACKEEHAGNEFMPYTRAQPNIGHFWLKLEENVCGSIPKVKIYYIPRMCNHCEKPSCIVACQSNAIFRRDDGFILIDPDKCTGCGLCKKECPYDAIYFNKKLKICQKCTGCAHLLDNGYKLPRCVEACPTDALQIGDETDMADIVDGAAVYRPETGNGPKVYYRNIPGQFIAGTVYDPADKEVIIGATCRATVGGKTYHTKSDSYGDFWFNDLPIGRFQLVIRMEGYIHKTFEDVSTKSCVNLGDIPLMRNY